MWLEPITIRRHEDDARLAAGPDRLDRLVKVEYERLLAEHVLAGPRRREDRRQVQMMRETDANGLHLGPAYHLLEVGRGARCAVLLGRFLRACQIVVARRLESDLPRLLQALPAGEVRAGDTAAAEYGDPNRPPRDGKPDATVHAPKSAAPFAHRASVIAPRHGCGWSPILWKAATTRPPAVPAGRRVCPR